MPDVFQNTIANVSFYSNGGTQLVTPETFVRINFANSDVVSKNMKDSNCSFTTKQNGTFYISAKIDFRGGDNKTYVLSIFKNGVVQRVGQTNFYQQASNLTYEVSLSAILELQKDDLIEFYIKLDNVSISSTILQATNINVVSYQLDQLGVH